MKNIKWILGLILPGMMAVSCTGEPDMPTPPDTDLNGNITISGLVNRYGKVAYAPIDTTLYIEGVVVANDVSGNLYKKIYVQDSTGGIDVEIDMTNNHHKYPVGQRLVIDLNGLAYGTYAKQPQIAAQGEGVTERLIEVDCDEHFHRKGYASVANVPEPVTATMVQLSAFKSRYIGRLVRVENVEFVDAGAVFVDPEAAEDSGNAQNRSLKDQYNNSLAARVSMYAMFALDTIPYGVGTVQGILGVYNDELQLFFRDANDMIGFSKVKPAGEASGTGSEDVE